MKNEVDHTGTGGKRMKALLTGEGKSGTREKTDEN